MFYTAKRQFNTTTGAKIVDVNLAAANRFCQTQLASTVVGPHAAVQAVGGSIRKAYCFGFVFEWHRDHDRAEDFVLRQCVLRGHIANQMRLNEETTLRCFRGNTALTGEFQAIVRGDFQETAHAIHLAFTNDRPAIQILLRSTDAQCIHARAQFFDHLVIATRFDQQAAAGGTGLPGVLNNAIRQNR